MVEEVQEFGIGIVLCHSGRYYTIFLGRMEEGIFVEGVESWSGIWYNMRREAKRMVFRWLTMIQS